MKTTIQSKIEKILLVVLLILLIAYSFKSQAQSRGRYGKASYGSAWSRDLGVELSVGAPHFKLQSNIAELNNLRTSYFGFNLGAVFATDYSKIKVTAGMYTSDDSVPYEIDFFQGGVSWSLYLLRMEGLQSHAIEPYFILGANLMHTRFYGNYLGPDVATNYSASNPPYLGKAGYLFANVGIGAEYQLESETLKFIHIFGQATYGVPGIAVYSDRAFSQTTAMGSVSYTFGINFAISR